MITIVKLTNIGFFKPFASADLSLSLLQPVLGKGSGMLLRMTSITHKAPQEYLPPNF